MAADRPSTGSQATSRKGGTIFISSIIVALFAAFASLQYYLPYASTCYSYRAYNNTQLGHAHPLTNGERLYRIAVITDLDHDSKHPEQKNYWRSLLKLGELYINRDRTSARVEWKDDDDKYVTSQIAAGGRSMELSDLAVFDGHLVTVDDRTGIVYRIDGMKDIIPWVLLNDGPGNVTKGFKAEWMTVKNKQLYVGGLGKEWTTAEGVFVNYHPMYVKIVGHAGDVQHVEWIENYKKLRSAVGIDFPGYMIHESGQWSDVHQKWFFLPRRASKETYSETDDEFRGTNLLLITDESFRSVEVRYIGNKGNGARGYAAFQFVPGTNDDIIVALKSEEKDGVPVASYLSVFTLSTGHVLLEEQSLRGPFKFEGITFV
jgi:soluble calcium-activated nucleotidase 1